MTTNETNLVVAKEDVRAVNVFICKIRGLPVPAIQEQFRIGRAQVYRDIAKGKEIFGLEPDQLVPDLVLLSGDVIREAYSELGSVDNMRNEDGKPLSGPAKNAVRMNILRHIDQFLANKRETVKLLTGQQTPETQLNVQVNAYPGQAKIIREERSFQQIVDELAREGKIPQIPRNTSAGATWFSTLTDQNSTNVSTQTKSWSLEGSCSVPTRWLRFWLLPTLSMRSLVVVSFFSIQVIGMAGATAATGIDMITMQLEHR